MQTLVSVRVIGAVLALVSCAFDSSGIGSGSGALGTSTGGSSSGSSELTTSIGASTVSTDATSDTAGSTSTTHSTTEVSATTGDGSSSGEPSCRDEFFKEVLTNADAQIVLPMEEGMLTDHPFVTSYAASGTVNQGTIQYNLPIPCEDTYFIWALVYDEERVPMLVDESADSFGVDLNSEPLLDWEYACQTLFQVQDWAYELVRSNNATCTAQQPLGVFMAEGNNVLRFTNLEEGSPGGSDPGSAAAIARIVVTNSSDYVPDEFSD